jgi:FkbM family methyltransferase
MNELAIIRKYWNLGGPSLVAKAIYSKAESTFGIYSHSDEIIDVELNGSSYTVSGDWSVNKWRQFERDVIMPEVTRSMREHLSKGDIFIDIGTARGGTTLYAHSLVGESGLVYAIEPDITQFKSLSENVERNNLQSIKYYNIAVSNNQGQIEPEKVVGQTTEEFQSLMDEIDTIDVTTLDKFVEKYEQPSLVKIDVDGAEGAVLEGATKHILGNVPIILEVHNSKLLDNRIEFIRKIFNTSNEVRYLAAQGTAMSEYPYGEILSSPEDLKQDVETNLLIR